MARVPLVDPVFYTTVPASFARNQDFYLYEEDGETPVSIYDAKTGGSLVAQPLFTGKGGVPSRASDGALCWVASGSYVREVDGIQQPFELPSGKGGEGGGVSAEELEAGLAPKASKEEVEDKTLTSLADVEVAGPERGESLGFDGAGAAIALPRSELDLRRDTVAKGEGEDETDIFVQALGDASEKGLPVVVPHGSWGFQEGEFDAAGGPAPQIEGRGRATKLLAEGKQILKMIGVYAQTDGGHLRNVHIENSADMAAGVPLFDLAKWRGGEISGLTGGHSGDYLGTVIALDSSYCVDWHHNNLRTGRYGVPIELNSVTEPEEQQDTFLFSTTQLSNSNFGAIIRNTVGNYNAIGFQAFKVVATAAEVARGWNEGRLTADSAIGATELTVGTTISGSFGEGDAIMVGYGANAEVAKVASVSGTKVTVSRGLQFAHPSGDPVIGGGVGISTSKGNWGIWTQGCHLEGLMIGHMAAGTRSIEHRGYYSVCADLVRLMGSDEHPEYGVRIGGGVSKGKPAAERNSIVTIWKPRAEAEEWPGEIVVDSPPILLNGGVSQIKTIDGQGASVSNAASRIRALTEQAATGRDEEVLNGSNANGGLTEWVRKIGGVIRAKRWRSGAAFFFRLGVKSKEITGNYTMTGSDPGLFEADGSAEQTLTLAAVELCENQDVTLVDKAGNAGTMNKVVKAPAGVKLDGVEAGTSKVTTNGGALTVHCNGTEWYTTAVKGAAGGGGEKGEKGATGETGPAGLTWKGTWATGTEYSKNDAVTFNGSSYRSKTEVTQKGHEPPNGTYWEVLAEKGATGATGATGEKGAKGDTGATGATGPSATTEEHTFALPGEITTASLEGMGFFLNAAEGETVRVRRLIAKIGSGTSATVKLQKNGADITGFTGLEAKTTKAKKEPVSVTGADEDFIGPVVTAVSGTPKNIVVTVAIERTRP